jgi:hypothetical protein
MAQSRDVNGIALSFATRPLNYKHPTAIAAGMDHDLAGAVAVAEAYRAHRAHVVAGIRDGSTTLAEVASSSEPMTLGIKVVVLAEAVPGVGKVAGRRILDELGIEDATRWGEIEPAGLAELVRLTGGGASPAGEP